MKIRAYRELMALLGISIKACINVSFIHSYTDVVQLQKTNTIVAGPVPTIRHYIGKQTQRIYAE